MNKQEDYDREFDEVFNIEEDTDTQDSLQNNVGERLSDISPAQTMDESSEMASMPIEKVIRPEYTYTLKKLEKLSSDINNAMNYCNDIERSIVPTLKKGTNIRDNFEMEIARVGERSLLYKQADVISNFASTFSTVDGYIKNIKFAMGRLQETIDDIEDRLKKE